ncbi:hypothetical protein SAMN02799630_01713 [Paenibacillus sp. UNCCL117]|uniref:DUF6509 family protein n=1 Tax=unclassified Paenibacillus TaxID=185978 RepID=UPI0008914F00|nr:MULTISPECIES: DUF6509 family protein [unclassified Paenibacillus]SDC91696.1 hypothetical protein SAMN04488602_104199 [Paenibacillus sp. cl123]SFW29139.1 hypothetical protein SAMN02799630_01713 [Paenibacillus sp. UNCCL117]
MFTVSEYTVEFVKDPFQILEGKRYEFIIDIAVPEDDELYSEHGLYIRVIYRVADDQGAIVKYDIYERTTDTYQDFDLEDDELAVLQAFCSEHWKEGEE